MKKEMKIIHNNLKANLLNIEKGFSLIQRAKTINISWDSSFLDLYKIASESKIKNIFFPLENSSLISFTFSFEEQVFFDHPDIKKSEVYMYSKREKCDLTEKGISSINIKIRNDSNLSSKIYSDLKDHLDFILGKGFFEKSKLTGIDEYFYHLSDSVKLLFECSDWATKGAYEEIIMSIQKTTHNNGS